MGVGQAPGRSGGDAMCVTVWTPEGVEMESQGQLLAFVRARKPDARLLSTHGNEYEPTGCLCLYDIAGTLEAAGLAYERKSLLWGDYRVLAEGGAP
jgi:hypothetical protein